MIDLYCSRYLNMDGKNMSNDEFINFLKEDETYKKLVGYKTYDFNEKVLSELNKHIPQITQELENNKIEYIPSSEEDIIEKYLEMIFRKFNVGGDYKSFFNKKTTEIKNNANKAILKIHKLIDINKKEHNPNLKNRLTDFKYNKKTNFGESMNKKPGKKIYITENQLEMIKKNSSLEIFEKEVRKFLYNLITNSNEKISEYWQLNGISKQKLLSTLFGYYIIQKDKETNEIKVPKYNFERKVKRMYYEIFPNKPVTIMHEDGEGATTCDGSSGAFEQPVFQMQRRKFN